VRRLLVAKGCDVEVHRHLRGAGSQSKGISCSPGARAACAFLDDDVVLEPDLVARLLKAIREQDCGFVGSALSA